MVDVEGSVVMGVVVVIVTLTIDELELFRFDS